MKLTKAGQAEILRAVQRDEVFKEQLGNDVSELLQLWGGVRMWIKYKEAVKMGSRILYEAMTTLLNLQTLGEEFTGMIQVNRSATGLPKKYLQVLMILLNNCGRKVFVEVIQRCKKKLKNMPTKDSLEKSSTKKLMKILAILEIVIPFLEKIHKTLFYFNGAYYELTKRLFGIRYVLVRYWLKDKTSLPAFKLLGILSIGYIVVQSIIAALNYQEEENKMKQVSPSTITNVPKSHNKCPLCLNVMKNASVTPCGHLFCWSCIILWLQEQPKCPLCRQSALPSRVVHLQKYSVVS